jgi:hypothetical protein
MLPGIFALVFFVALVVGPLAWRVWYDRRVERALTIRAHMHAAVVRALGGESFVSINVRPPAVWRRGRVELSAPSDWRFLLEPAWSAVMSRVPDDYELVVRPLPAPTGSIADGLAVRRAA